MQAESEACEDDFLQKIMGNNEEPRRHAVRADQNVSYQPCADYAAETKRERQYAYDRGILQNSSLPRRGRDGVYWGVTEYNTAVYQ